MGATIWVLPEGKEEDNWDHSFMLSDEKKLDAISNKLNVTKLSEFYDYEFEGNYIDIKDAIITLRALIKEIKTTVIKLKSKKELVEELEDCLTKIHQAQENNIRIRFSIVS